MQRLIAPFETSFRGLVNQRDRLALVVQASGPDTALALKVIQGIDEQSVDDLFFSFVDPFHDAASYVASVIERFKALHDLVRQKQREEQVFVWPPLPARIQADTLAPVARMRALMTFARALLPEADGFRLVWILMPLEIEDPVAYGAFVTALLEHRLPNPWCTRMRILVRDDRETPALSDLRDAPRIGHSEIDFGQDAIEQAYADEAGDEDVPLPQRMQALLMLANMDYAWQRYPSALKKYDLLNQFYEASENPTLAAISRNGHGEVFHRLGRIQEAQTQYEAALKAGIEAEAYVVVMASSVNLAKLHQEQRDWETAASYWDTADKMASTLLNVHTKQQALEQRGLCLKEQGQWEEALAAWKNAATLARGTDEEEPYERILQQVQELCKQYGGGPRYRQFLEEVDAALAEHPPLPELPIAEAMAAQAA